MVIACWCQREETPERPLSDSDKERLRFLYEEWAHPYFISMQEFCRIMEVGAVWGVTTLCSPALVPLDTSSRLHAVTACRIWLRARYEMY